VKSLVSGLVQASSTGRGGADPLPPGKFLEEGQLERVTIFQRDVVYLD
jgi:hypothetical protein